MSSTVQLPNGVVVMTIVYPQTVAGSLTEKKEPNISKEISNLNTPREIQDTNNPRPATPTAWLKSFIRTQQKTLGAIQIIIGLINIGIPLAFTSFSIAPISGVVSWGGLLYIVSGSLTVSNDKRTSIRKAKKTLVMNVVSSVVAFVAVILLIVDAAIYIRCYYPYCNNYDYSYWYNRYPTLKSITIILCLLEELITISLSVYIFKTSPFSRCCLPQPTTMIVTPDVLQIKQAPLAMDTQPAPPPYRYPTPLLKNEATSPKNESTGDYSHLLTPSSSPLLSQVTLSHWR
ncbi:membrane-spanning 4-domains subfamily A member 4A-like [Protopterus annectens]|uniref:membrane-spanning 4-domains subfamily A member 4A-like n=1 Tax=Protopterus annectens TaxID=7888 RepID=UPI001CFC1C78|nr:membrane-spanning 4-domains subfamily A member 4A-like [Protopterus annectens]